MPDAALATRIDKALEAHARGPFTPVGNHLHVTCLCGWRERVAKLGNGKGQHRMHVAQALTEYLTKDSDAVQ
jgi:hypothetical protein